MGGHVNYDWDRWRVRLGMTRTEHRLEGTDEYMQGIEQFEQSCAFIPGCDPAFPEYIRAMLAPANIYITSLGVAYDRGPLQVQAMLSTSIGPATKPTSTQPLYLWVTGSVP